MGEPVLREATEADIPALLDLESRCYHPAIAYGEEEYRDYFIHSNAVNLVVEEGGRIIAFGGAFTDDDLAAAYVYTVNVDPAERRRGLARRLMDDLESHVRRAGARRARLEVNVTNREAIRLYEHCGYVRIARIPDYYVGYEQPDAYLYEKAL